MKILFIFILGFGILVGAIILNAFAAKVGFTSWYEFLKNPSSTPRLSYLWLFILYPLGLGLIGFFLHKLLF